MAELDNEVKISFGAELDKAFNAILSEVEKGFREIERSGTASIDEINDRFARLNSDLDNLNISLKISEQKFNKFANTENIDDLSRALIQSRTVVQNFESSLESLKDTYSYVLGNGGSPETLANLDNEIKAISDSLENYKREMEGLSEGYVNDLAEASRNLSDESERAAAETEAINSIMETLGVSAEEAAEKFGGAASKAAEIAKAFATGGVQAAALKVAMTALSAAAAAAVGLIVKGIKSVVNSIKEEIKYRKELRNSVSEANADAIKEMAELNRLNEELNRAGQNTQEYARVKNEIVKKYGKYNSQLGEEIARVGNLSQSYQQLANSILQAAMARQRDKMISEQVDKYAKDSQKQFSKLRQKTINEFGKDEGERLYQEAFTQLNSASFDGILQGDAKKLDYLFSKQINAIWNSRRRLIRKTDEITGTLSSGTRSSQVDFSDDNAFYSAQLNAEEKLRRMREEETAMLREANQTEINAMADGAAKQRAQAELDYNKRIDQLKSQQEGLKEQYAQMAKAEWLKNGGSESTFSLRDIYSQLDYALSGNMVGPLSPTQQKYADAVKKNEEMQQKQEKVYNKMLSDISFQESQSNAENYGSNEQKRQAIIDKYKRQLSQIPKAYKEAAEKKKEYELALFDYEAIKGTGNESAEKEALKRMLDAEIETLEGAKKEAAIKRKALTLAEFGKDDIEKYGTTSQRKELLENTLSAEVKTIDDKYKEVKDAMDKLARAEFGEESISEYGTSTQKREARLAVLRAQAEVTKKKNGIAEGSAEAQRIDAGVNYEIAKWDWERIMDLGSFDDQLAALKNKWDAYIATLDEDQKRGATQQMNSAILDLKKKYDDSFKNIFRDEAEMTIDTLKSALVSAKEALNNMSSSDFSDADREAMLNRVKALSQEIYEYDSKGVVSTLSQVFNLGKKWNIEKDILRTTKSGTEQYKNQLELVTRLESELQHSINSTALAETTSRIGEALSQIGSITKNSALQEAATTVSGFGSAIQNLMSANIGGFISDILGLGLNLFTSIEKSKQEALEMQKAMKGLANELRDIRDEKLLESFSTVFGTDNLGRFQAQYDMFKKYTDTLEEFRSLGKGLKDPLSEYANRPEGQSGRGGKAEQVRFDREFGHLLDGISGSFFDDLGNLKGDEITAWYQALTDEQKNLMTDTARMEIEDLISYWEDYKKALAGVKEYLQSLLGDTAGDLSDKMLENFVKTGSVIFDMTDSMQGFTKAMAKSVIESKLLGQVFNDEAQEEMAALIAKGDTNGAISMYNDLLAAANAMAPEIEEFLRGINYNEIGAAGDRGTSVKGLAALSQESADELNGRFTAFQISAANIDETTRVIREQNDALVLRSNEMLLELMGIHTDTTDLRASVEELSNTCGVIQEGVSRIIRDGVRMN